MATHPLPASELGLDLQDSAPVADLHVVADLDDEEPLEPTQNFNTLDLVEELSGRGYNGSELTFARLALSGQVIRFARLRDEEWDILTLSDEEYREFLTSVPRLKVAIADFVIEHGLIPRWTQDRRQETGHRLRILTSQAQAAEVAEQEARATERMQKGPAPTEGDFMTFYNHYRKRIVQTVAAITRGHANPMLDKDDLLQLVSAQLFRKFDELGVEIFTHTMISRIAKLQLMDELRNVNWQTRSMFGAVTLGRSMCDDGFSREEVAKEIEKSFPGMEPRRIQMIIDHAFDGTYISELTSLEALLTQPDSGDFVELPSDWRAPDTLGDSRPSPEIIQDFLDTYLTPERWKNYGNSHYRGTETLRRAQIVARMYLVERQTMAFIAGELGVTESRISQILNDDVYQTLRENIEAADLTGQDVAEMLNAL